MSVHHGKYVAYRRVSTDKQGIDGYGIDAQDKAVRDRLNGGHWKLVATFTEVESGRRRSRPELQAALAACRKHKAKLIVGKLDRLARDTKFLLTLLDSGVEVLFCDLPHIPGAMGRFVVTQMAAVAELEAGLISERTKAGLAAAKRRGVRLGNPRLAVARTKAIASNQTAAGGFAANIAPIIRDIQSSGIASHRAIARALTARGIQTSRGGRWTPVQVGSILRRTESEAPLK